VYERELGPIVAAVSYLTAGQAAGARLDPARELILKKLLLDKTTAVQVQTYAMSQLSPAYKDIDNELLAAAVAEKKNHELTHHWIAWLASRGSGSGKGALSSFLLSDKGSDSNRADAFAALASLNSKDALDLYHSSKQLGDSPAVKLEVERVEGAGKLDAAQFPDRNNVSAWLPLVAGKGNKDEGWRVWIRSQCVKCHALDGRGATVGPDLAAIARGASTEQLLTSILQPSKEVAPLFVTWKVLTAEGKVILGSKVNGGGVGEANRYLLADGTTIDVAQEDIEEQQPVLESIMPENIAQTISVDELADLMALFDSYKQIQ
jgi:putative heme-binding domain-containing protein